MLLYCFEHAIVCVYVLWNTSLALSSFSSQSWIRYNFMHRSLIEFGFYCIVPHVVIVDHLKLPSSAVSYSRRWCHDAAPAIWSLARVFWCSRWKCEAKTACTVCFIVKWAWIFHMQILNTTKISRLVCVLLYPSPHYIHDGCLLSFPKTAVPTCSTTHKTSTTRYLLFLFQLFPFVLSFIHSFLVF